MTKLLAGLTAVVAVLVLVVALLLSAADPRTDLPLEVAKLLANLTIAVLITGVLSAFLAQRNNRRAMLDERARVLAEALQELKAGYERIQVARFFLAAHPTGKTFMEQIHAMTEARSRLHKVQRERFVLGTEVETLVQQMLDYLNALGDLYVAQYASIAEDALKEERIRKNILEGRDDLMTEIATLPGSHFQAIVDLLDEEKWESGEFHQSYSAAKKQLQAWLDEPHA